VLDASNGVSRNGRIARQNNSVHRPFAEKEKTAFAGLFLS
jgi:hypothetical protein